MNWAWVPPHLVISWHEQLLKRFGGAPGLRDFGLLEGALDRPKNLVAYHPESTLHQLGALYGVAVAKAHAFVDGNKRIAFAVMVAFLKAEGQMLDVTEAAATAAMLDVARGAMSEDQLHVWLLQHCRAE